MKARYRLLVLLLAGCTGQDWNAGQGQGGVIRLTFGRVGQNLSINGCPTDPGYSAEYPNPDEHEKMDVEVDEEGRVSTQCSGSSGPCREPPVYTRVVEKPTGDIVRVYDVYGKKIAEACPRCSGSSSASDGDDEGDKDSDKDSETDSDDNSDGTGADDGEGEEGGSEGGAAAGGCGVCTASAPTPASPAASCPEIGNLPALKTEFCAKVNDRLVSLDSKFVLDCAKVPDTFSKQTVQRGPNPRDLGCFRDIIDPSTQSMETKMTCGTMRKTFDAWRNFTRNLLYQCGECTSSPLVLDLDGNGIQLSDLKGGVRFDLFADGLPVRTAWPRGGDALLALDRNGDGRIGSGAELFGSHSGHAKYPDGFAALAELDDNADGKIDAADRRFAQLRVWTDRNHDGVSSQDELRSLQTVNITTLHVQAMKVSDQMATDVHGNRILLSSTAVRSDGTRVLLVDAFFKVAPLTFRIATK